MTALYVVTGIAFLIAVLRVVDERVVTSSGLFVACLQDDVARIEEILSRKPSLINARTKQGFTALHYAVMDPNRDGDAAVRVLIGHGADVNAPDNVGFTPLQMATLADNASAIATLREHGAEL